MDKEATNHTVDMQMPTIACEHLSESSIAMLEDRYGFNIEHVEQLGAGSGNTNHCLKTNEGAFVLSTIEEQPPEDVANMAQLLSWIERHGFRTSTLKPLINGDSLLMLEGKPAFARSFLAGDTKRVLTNKMAYQLGKSIGDLHALPSPEFLPTSLYYENKQFQQTMDLGIDTDFEHWLAQVTEHYKRHRFGKIPTGLIHADIFWDNVLFAGEDLVAIIDFELACNYWLVFDVCMAIVGTCAPDGRLSFSLAANLVRGYQSQRALEPQEMDVLPLFCEYAAATTANWRYWRYRWKEPQHRKVNSYMEMVAIAKQVGECGHTQVRNAVLSLEN